MLIRSQNRERLANMDGFRLLHIEQFNREEKFSILVGNEIFGEYSEKERAKAILDMISEAYQHCEKCKYMRDVNANFIFYMPEDDPIQ